jgi:hypothetical protein
MQVNVMSCKKRLATLWLVGSAVIFFIILFQTFFDHYSGKAEEAWSWFLPTVLPTLSLMIGALVTDALGGGSTEKRIDSFIFKLSFYLSIFYFVIVFLTVMMQPFVTNAAVKFLKQSNLWLAPIQGLVAASLGAFFVKTGQG